MHAPLFAPDPTKPPVGELLREYRLRRGLSLSELAYRASRQFPNASKPVVSASYLGQVERGKKTNVSSLIFQALAPVLDPTAPQKTYILLARQAGILPSEDDPLFGPANERHARVSA